jgi:hypothetical protein
MKTFGRTLVVAGLGLATVLTPVAAAHAAPAAATSQAAVTAASWEIREQNRVIKKYALSQLDAKIAATKRWNEVRRDLTNKGWDCAKTDEYPFPEGQGWYWVIEAHCLKVVG